MSGQLFIVFGLLLLLFTFGVASEFQNGKASKAGPLLLLITAICFLLSGPFVMDPIGTLPNKMSVHGILHGIFGGIVFSHPLYRNPSLIGLVLFNEQLLCRI